ncbi:hypothetical protein [Thomasclavelia sp.]
MERIEIVLVEKGANGPGSTANAFYKYNSWLSNLKVVKSTLQFFVVLVISKSYVNISMHTKK